MVEENRKNLLNVSYKTIKVNSMGDKCKRIIYAILSFIAVIVGIAVIVCFFVTDFSTTGDMSISEHTIFGLVLSFIFSLIFICMVYNFIDCIRIIKDHKIIELYIIEKEDMFRIGDIPEDMYTCFISDHGMIIGWKDDERYINDFLGIDKSVWYFYEFKEIYEKQSSK